MAERKAVPMAQKTIEIQELQEQLSSHLQEIREGETLMITEQGKPVAWLVPFTEEEGRDAKAPAISKDDVSIEEKLQRLVEAGVISWSGRKPSLDIPTFQVQGPKTVAEMLLEDRD
jgi:antitoxin (DNA-binding transcriptional repressor) of toxin-antitoxin stability system